MAGDQITVAQLLARKRAESAAKGAADAPAPNDTTAPAPRRRHRNLEEGGVSVAELTGSIPKVDDDSAETATNRRSRSAQAAAAGKKPADDKSTSPAPSDADVEKSGAEALGADKTDVKKSEDEALGADKTDVKKSGEAKADATKVEGQKTDATKTDASEGDAKGDEKKPGAEKPNANSVKAEVTSVAKDDKTELKTADEKAQSEAKESHQDPTANAKVVLTSPAEDDTINLPPVPDTPDMPLATPPAVAKASSAEGVSTDETLDPTSEAPSSDAAVSDSADEVNSADDSKVNIPVLIVEVLVALAIGVGIFKGFEVLWMDFSNIITGTLAVIVTAVIAGVVHALIRERDKLIVLFAVIVGLALTFGPMLIIGV